MTADVLDRIIQKLTFLGPLGDAVHKWLGRLLAGDSPTALAKEFLNGSWLGHPLHPALTDVPIGAWMGASLLDVADGGRGGGMGRGAGMMGGVGCAGGGGG